MPKHLQNYFVRWVGCAEAGWKYKKRSS